MFRIVTLIGKATKRLSQLFGGNGTALAGLVVERLYPGWLARAMNQLPGGVIVVSGTNGKTTTTKIITELLEARGQKVLTNPSGSNFVRGVIAATLDKVKHGHVQATVAVLELDEAYAVHFVRRVKPRITVLLNLFRDQLDRFGELDKTAELLKKVAEQSSTVIINSCDQRLVDSTKKLPKNIKRYYFGYADKLDEAFKSVDQLETVQHKKFDMLLVDQENSVATYQQNKQIAKTKLKLEGSYNALNAAAALLAIKTFQGNDFDLQKSCKELEKIEPAFGRGEKFTVDGKTLQFILVKNPTGFRVAINSIVNEPVLIAINDNYADGRDVSWLYDVDFTTLRGDIYTTGVRAHDIAVRLLYDGLIVKGCDTDYAVALRKFIKNAQGDRIVVAATYTAMVKMRKLLGKGLND